jgi:protein gp37
MKLGPYKVHPVAEKFAMLDEAELKALAEDIKRNGLQQPIVLNHDGTVLLDGRNRWRACEIASADVVEIRLGQHYTETQLVDYIVSANIKRRHLSAGQRDMLGADLKPFYAAGTKRGRPKGGDSPTITGKARDQAAAAVGASGREVDRADAIKQEYPDLAEQVRNGMEIAKADRERKKRNAGMPKPDKRTAERTALTLYTHEGNPVEYAKRKGVSKFNETPSGGISWAAWSWNPVTGCLHGCPYCYAREIATSKRFADAYPIGFTPLFHSERLQAPANTTIPAKYRDDNHQPCGDGECQICAYRRVFVCSMADLYGRWVPQDWIDQVHAAMLDNPQWQYITLTKFPDRYPGLKLPDGAWIGTSVDEQKRVRIAERAFTELPDDVTKWLSLEPLREPLEFTDLSMFDWIVIGAQTATRQPDGIVPSFAPPFDWVDRIYRQAREAGCAIHMKPNLGIDGPGMQLPNEYPRIAE